MSETSTPAGSYWTSGTVRAGLRRRHRRDGVLKWLGLGAIVTALLLLGILVVSLVSTGYQAFVQSKVELRFNIDPGLVDADNPFKGNYRKIARDALQAYFPDVTGRRELSELAGIVTSGAPYIVREHVVDNPEVIGRTITLNVPLSDPFDQLNKGVIPAKIDALTDTEVNQLRTLERRGLVSVEDGQSLLALDITVDPAKIPDDDIASGRFGEMLSEGMRALFSLGSDQTLLDIIEDGAAEMLGRRVADNPDLIGRSIQIKVPLAENLDQLHRGSTPTITNPRFESAQSIAWFNQLKNDGLVTTPFNWALLTNADSRFPELAGLSGALWGSFYALLVCFLISFPVGISAAIYLEEFAPKNRWTDLIEVNINNLAAVPSIVFGLLGLAVFLQTFHLPRSAPLVGGMTLSLMTLPTIIIATRAALKAVPPSIRQAAMGVGASRHQVVLHHVLPLAMPGILTGTIIGLAQALGETAPLLLIGMNAFITSASGGILDPATALPTQIFIWADSPERGFVARTSAGILVLLGFLVLMNTVAIVLRKHFERRW